MPRPPTPLPDELMEDVLLRLPPENPAGLVRAGLVCTQWCRLVSDPGFRRRFCEFHRRPPMLGMLINLHSPCFMVRFVPTTALCSPRTDRGRWHAVDARHGRVLFRGKRDGVFLFMVWNPITDEKREFPFPQQRALIWTAAVLCSAAGACDHLDCHRRSFLVVLVCCQRGKTFLQTYSSDAAAAAWSEPLWAHQHYYLAGSTMSSALVGNALYFGSNLKESTALKYNLESRQMSPFRLPSLPSLSLFDSLLTTSVDGGLALVNKHDSKLYMWSTKDTHEVDAKWERRVIELKTAFPVDVVVDDKLGVIGSGVGTIFMRTGDDEVYAIDLKTYEVKKVYEGTAHRVIPYMSFYTPALKGTCAGEGPSAGQSSA